MKMLGWLVLGSVVGLGSGAPGLVHSACLTDSPARFFPTSADPKTHDLTLTPKLCWDLCLAQQGTPLIGHSSLPTKAPGTRWTAGLQSGRACWCGTYAQAIPAPPSTGCNLPCPGEPTVTCGGYSFATDIFAGPIYGNNGGAALAHTDYGGEDGCEGLGVTPAFGTSSDCFWVGDAPAAWADAGGVCEGSGGQLATVLSSDIADVLLDQFLFKTLADEGFWLRYEAGTPTSDWTLDGAVALFHPPERHFWESVTGPICAAVTAYGLEQRTCTQALKPLCSKARGSGKYRLMKDTTVKVGTTVLAETTAKSAWHCALECRRTDKCLSVQYNAGTEACQLYAQHPMDVPDAFESTPAATSLYVRIY